MANYYTIVVPECGLPCSRTAADHIAQLLDTADGPHGFTVDYKNKQLFLIADESGWWDWLPEAALQAIGQLIVKAKMPYWEFGVAYTCSRLIADSHGGSNFRIMRDGRITTRTCRWPEDDESVIA
ncbi:MAG: hypothetical protein A3H28_03045 [Acidobacteria bacterium RIFCSPLOWO2_02_FULL_61_28]|nr:MAG: hypothetical protein A3H28_03045 [Acidobacteria bacterium RIFCSPLOWO2_02_FULL_61_28]